MGGGWWVGAVSCVISGIQSGTQPTQATQQQSRRGDTGTMRASCLPTSQLERDRARCAKLGGARASAAQAERCLLSFRHMARRAGRVPAALESCAEGGELLVLLLRCPAAGAPCWQLPAGDEAREGHS